MENCEKHSKKLCAQCRHPLISKPGNSCSAFFYAAKTFVLNSRNDFSFPVDFRKSPKKLSSPYRPMPRRFCRKRLIKFRRCIRKWKCW
mgnify:CR=1 FL=1